MNFSEDQINKIREFKWEDEEADVNDSEIEDIQGSQFAENYLNCAESILKVALDNIKFEHFDDSTVTIPIPLSTHELLVEKYKRWSEHSKHLMFRMVQGSVLLLAEENYKNLFEEKINSKDFFHGPKVKVQWIHLYDNPTLSMDDNIFSSEIVIEIGYGKN